jgi:hypothetical protein
MTDKFYRDYKRPEVEEIARKICGERGDDPDKLVAETGYSNARKIPLWWMYQDDAMYVLVALKLMKGEYRDPNNEAEIQKRDGW